MAKTKLTVEAAENIALKAVLKAHKIEVPDDFAKHLVQNLETGELLYMRQQSRGMMRSRRHP